MVRYVWLAPENATREVVIMADTPPLLFRNAISAGDNNERSYQPNSQVMVNIQGWL